MGTIRIVWGTGTGPTATSSYDAALAEANVHDYNLVTVSSVVPAASTVEAVGTAPDLGPAGERLTVVEGRATVAPDDPGPAVATLAWARAAAGDGLFYEAAGTAPDAVADRAEAGLAAGCELREWPVADRGRRTASTPAPSDAHATAVVLAVYGDSTPIL
jgi:arginine decarboxylase